MDIGLLRVSGTLTGTVYPRNFFCLPKTLLFRWMFWLNSATCLSSELFLSALIRERFQCKDCIHFILNLSQLIRFLFSQDPSWRLPFSSGLKIFKLPLQYIGIIELEAFSGTCYIQNKKCKMTCSGVIAEYMAQPFIIVCVC